MGLYKQFNYEKLGISLSDHGIKNGTGKSKCREMEHCVVLYAVYVQQYCTKF